MRSLRFWIAATVFALAAGAVIGFWPEDAKRPLPAAPVPGLEPLAEPAPAPAGTVAPPPAPRVAIPPPAPPPAGATSPDEPAAPDRALVREALQEAFAEKLPDRRLSEEEFDKLADAVLRMRAARERMAALSLTRENAAELAQLREDLNTAVTDFEYVSELTPSAFSALVEPDLQPIRKSPDAGVDSNKDKDEDVTFEYLHDTPPQ
ncbi:MAG: hypothetical protein Q8R92_02260 [Deltaproteobacteria bacterium]|nr:hypothetical protein [Deltaproteobacteria bacterium]